MIDEQLPNRAPLSASGSIQSPHPPILFIRQVVRATIVCCHVFRRTGYHRRTGLAWYQRIRQIAKSIVSLIVSRLKSVRQQAQRRHGMPLIAPALLHLVQIT